MINFKVVVKDCQVVIEILNLIFYKTLILHQGLIPQLLVVKVILQVWGLMSHDTKDRIKYWVHESKILELLKCVYKNSEMVECVYQANLLIAQNIEHYIIEDLVNIIVMRNILQLIWCYLFFECFYLISQTTLSQLLYGR